MTVAFDAALQGWADVFFLLGSIVAVVWLILKFTGR